MIKIAKSGKASAKKLFCNFLDSCISKDVRDIEQFACDEIVIPNGEFEGQSFTIETQPYVRLLWNEITNGVWSTYVITGPTQSGKSLCAFVIPILHIAIELKTTCVVGVPDGNMINDKWNEDFRPVLNASPTLQKMIPNKGAGSKGGNIKESVTLQNGVTLRFMTRGGSDQSKAGFTARHVVVTEAAGWSKGTETSKEPNPLKQITGRQRATSRFDDEGNLIKSRLTIIEGTVTDEFDLPLSEQDSSSDSKIMSQCPHCSSWVAPEREHFGGYEHAENEQQAAKNGSFFCPGCGEAISELERRTMVENSLLVHAGQEIVDGKVVGDQPPTSTMFFRWSAFHNLFSKSADFATEEWKCLQIEEETPEREEAEKTLCQQVWAIAYKPPTVEHEQLVRKDVQRRRRKIQTNIIPEDCDKFAIGVDVGLYRCWWFAIVALKNGLLYCPAYGAEDTSLTGPDKNRKKHHERNAIKACLAEMFAKFERGYPVINSKSLRKPDMVFIDSNYHKDAVIQSCHLMGKGPKARYMPILGVGRTKMDSRKFMQPKALNQTIRMIGDRFYLEYVPGDRAWRVQLDADRSKLDVQACLRADMDTPGALSLSDETLLGHAKVSKHLASEVYKRWIENGVVKEEWVKSGQNHLLDCAGYGLTALKFLKFKIPTPKQPIDKTNDQSNAPAQPKSWLERQLESMNQ